ncbi:MAG TPA: hypothetical protein VFY32_05970, partial [Solirubrobacteraceae bacterium]|nr:hypothetical protein [Solirubrobacteraceae bacterium]
MCGPLGGGHGFKVLRDLARQAGVSHAAPRRHFAGKHRPGAADSLREAADAAFAAPLALITDGQAAGAVVPGDP